MPVVRKGREHLLRVPVGLHVVHHLGDVPLGVDHERRALDAPVRLAAEVLLAPDAVALRRLVLGIGKRLHALKTRRQDALVLVVEPA